MKGTALLLLAMGWVLAAQAQSTDSGWDVGGHSKFRLNYFTYPDDSVFRDVLAHPPSTPAPKPESNFPNAMTAGISRRTTS